MGKNTARDDCSISAAKQKTMNCERDNVKN